MSDNSDDALPLETEETAIEETPAGPVRQRVAIAPSFNTTLLAADNATTNWYTTPMPMPAPPQIEQVFNQAMQTGYNAHQQYESESIQRLRAIRNAVQMSILGGLEITKPKYISASAVGALARWVAAQCIGDNIAQSEHGLYIRDLMPHHDLLAGSDGAPIQEGDEWITPDPRRFVGGYDTAEEHSIYITSRNSDNDRKVILIYGIHNLNDGVPLYAKRLDFMRGTIKRITLTQLDSLAALDGFYFFQTPLIFKKNDGMNVRATVGRQGVGHTDKIKILGMVGEMLGQNYNG